MTYFSFDNAATIDDTLDTLHRHSWTLALQTFTLASLILNTATANLKLNSRT
jgi:hypothetical protein